MMPFGSKMAYVWHWEPKNVDNIGRGQMWVWHCKQVFIFVVLGYTCG